MTTTLSFELAKSLTKGSTMATSAKYLQKNPPLCVATTPKNAVAHS
jgi:hypothetical protein